MQKFKSFKGVSLVSPRIRDTNKSDPDLAPSCQVCSVYRKPSQGNTSERPSLISPPSVCSCSLIFTHTIWQVVGTNRGLLQK